MSNDGTRRTTPPVLLTVSGSIDTAAAEQSARGERPRADYLELARVLPADVLDYPAAWRAGGWVGRLFARLGAPNLMLAWVCFRWRGRYEVIFTDGEQVGLPFAALERGLGAGRCRPRHVMITHILSKRKKSVLLDLLGLQHAVDLFLVYATHQKRFIEQRWHIPPTRVIYTPFMVDSRFYAPELAPPRPTPRPQICAVGREARDYPTLLKAVDGLEADVVIAAGSPWSRRADSLRRAPLPPNVQVRRFSFVELRQLYADSRFALVPLANVAFQAGITSILEAMAMGRAVICSRVPGQTDIVVDGETGLYVPPGDPAALRAAIEHLLAHPEEAERMGRAGRARVEQYLNLDRYAERLARYAAECRRAAPGGMARLGDEPMQR
jgi:glycosyltransferase involved in cell wall biosynthesis